MDRKLNELIADFACEWAKYGARRATNQESKILDLRRVQATTYLYAYINSRYRKRYK